MINHQNVDDTELKKKIFNTGPEDFVYLAIKIFHYQYNENPVYRQYCDALQVDAASVKRLEQIPFLPIQFFKTRQVKTSSFEGEIIFESSGTTGYANSQHHIKDTGLYKESFLHAFRLFYGDISRYCILGLLPSYLERNNSSLVLMTGELINKSGHPESGFYLYDVEKLHQVLLKNEANSEASILIGVTYALLDFFEKYRVKLKHCIIMETGGMKGRKKEITREAVHKILKQQSGVDAIHAEYGMTELLSQAYSKKDGIFFSPPWMKILIREEDDPFAVHVPGNGKQNVTGVINIIDFANLYSCSFIATDDVGRLFENGSFEVLGRLDNSDVRGCSLMVI